MFEQENALPRSELHSSLHNRNRLATACQHHADVGWHVVAAFRIVREVVGIFGHQALKKFFQVASCGGIGVFHDDDAATGVLNKNRNGPVLNAALVDLRLNVISDFIETFAMGAYFELVVVNVHF